MNATSHPVAPEEIMAFLDGELSAERSQSVSAHVEACPECQEVATSLRNTSHSLSNWTVAAIPVKLENRVITATQETPSRFGTVGSNSFLRARRWTWKRWGLTVATSGCALLLLMAVSIPNLLRSRMAADEAAAVARHRPMVESAASVDVAAVNMDRSVSGSLGKLQVLSGFAAPLGRPQASGSLPAGPMIARTVSLSIVAKDFEAARNSLDAILARHNGYAAGLNVSTPQVATRTLQASLRIPAPQLPAALAELKSLGRVEVETQNGEEVTQQHADLVARLKNSRETEQRLQDVLRTRTGKVKDVLEVEQEIARVRGEIEQMEAEQKNLEHRVDFATIDLKLAEEYKAQLTSPAPSVAMQLRNATVNGFRSAFESLLALVLFLAESGPTLILWLGLLSFPAWWLWRRYQRAQALTSSVGA